MQTVLLQTNKYFTEETWLTVLGEQLPGYNNSIIVDFASSGIELKQKLPHSDYCYCIKLPEDIILSDIKLKLLYHGISDLDYLNLSGLPSSVQLCSSRGIASQHIAEYCVMMALTMTRKYDIAKYNKRKKKWDQTEFLLHDIKPLSEYKIGVLGIGNNGGKIASTFKSLGCQVAGYSDIKNDDAPIDKWFSINHFDDILEYADILIIALPLREETKNLISMSELTKLGRDAYLINVSRGAILNEDDLIHALKENLIKAAAIDVTMVEPLPKRSKLWKLDNLMITPHIAGNINFLTRKIQQDFVKKLKEKIVTTNNESDNNG